MMSLTKQNLSDILLYIPYIVAYYLLSVHIFTKNTNF